MHLQRPRSKVPVENACSQAWPRWKRAKFGGIAIDPTASAALIRQGNALIAGASCR